MSQPPAAPYPPPARGSRPARVLLTVVAVVLALCGGGTAVAWYALRDEVVEVVEATGTRVVAPETLAGRPKVTDPELQRLADQAVGQMRSTVRDGNSTVAGFYGDPDTGDLVMVAATAGLLADPERELDRSVEGLATDLGVATVAPVEPGPLGGAARCGDGRAQGLPLGVCVWADRGSLGLVVLFDAAGADARAEFVTIRGQVERRD
ncbi:hypothetical protein AWW66_13700 [Micromonospora rosaria]|uniref:Uncharacterized protein n=1 Tax=Micromonospora rosaria TaxID=47874 RepID=A0A136PSJ4_9ACTN|nr:hypothetical protein [Micromonospora rosaria]KXK61449.1 hypothetical protein AWW66_13700 [Micromonospora rosaria]